MLSVRRPPGKKGALTELEKAKAEAERAKADWAAAQARADQARAKLAKSTRDAKVRLRVTAVVMMMAALIKLGWEAAHEAPLPVSPSVVQPLAATTSAKPVSSSANSTQSEAALDRLRDAFHSFPDEDQPDVVREVNTRYAGTEFTCPLTWADGKPALSLKVKGGSKPMMAAALNQCATGVEKLRKERDASMTR